MLKKLVLYSSQIISENRKVDQRLSALVGNILKAENGVMV